MSLKMAEILSTSISKGNMWLLQFSKSSSYFLNKLHLYSYFEQNLLDCDFKSFISQAFLHSILRVQDCVTNRFCVVVKVTVSEGRRPEEESSFWKISAERSRLEGEQADFQSLTPSQIKSIEKGEKPLPSYLRQVSVEKRHHFSLTDCSLVSFLRKTRGYCRILKEKQDLWQETDGTFQPSHTLSDWILKLRYVASVKPQWAS